MYKLILGYTCITKAELRDKKNKKIEVISFTNDPIKVMSFMDAPTS